MFKLTQEQWLMYVRIALQWAAASLGTTAFFNGSTGQFVTAAVVAGATLLWTAYATRIAAKLNELIGADVIEIAVVKDQAVADSVTSDKVVSIADVRSPNMKTSTAEVSVLPKAA
jgi:kynureninase